jgi:adenosylcobinamide kinase/adenosylcobinamide-phosphate guanylyltransferase
MSLLFVIGGARSGKSRYAQRRVETLGMRLAYVATGQALDSEMADRIARHRADRGQGWDTIEAPVDLAPAIGRASGRYDAILVDCLTLWLSNLMGADIAIDRAVDELSRAMATCASSLSVIANEVGLGIVPDNALARRFGDEAGRLNQRIAKIADEVVFVATGLPCRLKSAASSSGRWKGAARLADILSGGPALWAPHACFLPRVSWALLRGRRVPFHPFRGLRGPAPDA